MQNSNTEVSFVDNVGILQSMTNSLKGIQLNLKRFIFLRSDQLLVGHYGLQIERILDPEHELRRVWVAGNVIHDAGGEGDHHVADQSNLQ